MFKTILIALDDSELAQQIVTTLGEVQLSAAAKVILVHVVSPAESGVGRPADQPYLDPKVGLYRHIEQRLQNYQAELPSASEIEIVVGDPAEEIIRLANIYHADLVVIGNRGLTGVNRILQGSVSSQVVTDSPCSVLVVKPV